MPEEQTRTAEAVHERIDLLIERVERIEAAATTCLAALDLLADSVRGQTRDAQPVAMTSRVNVARRKIDEAGELLR